MITKHRVSLNGIELDSLDNRIIILGVNEAAGKDTFSAVSTARGSGQRLTQQRRDTLDVTVRFAIKGPKDVTGRSQVFDAAAEWAYKGGWLIDGIRPDRRLYVVCYQLATMGDMWEWTDEYTITFRAYGVPFWSQTLPASVTYNVMSTSAVTRGLEVGGTTAAPLELSYTNDSSTALNTLSVSCDGYTLAFTELGLGYHETLTIDHAEDGIQRIRIVGVNGNTRSAMKARTTESDDEVWLAPGQRSIVFQAGQTGRLTLSCYGRYA